MSDGLPTMSVITPSLNQARFVERTIRSVVDQEYPGLQYIVVDGGSSDGTVDIVRRYRDHLASWCSEADRGQVHAINKGLAQATGDVVAFLNSDDLYLPGALSAIGQAFARDARLSWLCGDTLFFGDVGGPVHLARAVVPSSLGQLLCWEYKAPQPGMFWRRETLRGGFDEQWRYCFDHAKYLDLVLEGHRCHHLSLPVAGYRLHPSSKTVAEAEGFEREFDAIAEHYEPLAPWLIRRRSRAVRLLRRSYAESRAGRPRRSGLLLGQAFLTSPFEISRRPFWGVARAFALCLFSRRGDRLVRGSF